MVDASLPNVDWLEYPAARKLSGDDGAVHTAVLGRPLGLDPAFLRVLAPEDVHVHCHGLRDKAECAVVILAVSGTRGRTGSAAPARPGEPDAVGVGALPL